MTSTVPQSQKSQTAAEYFARPGLSNSGMTDLAVSPLRYWHLHINPNRPAERVTPEMEIGSAIHCAVLEPGEFDKRYAREIDPTEHEGLLVTMEDLRGWLKDKGLTPKGTRKAEAIAQVQAQCPDWPILDVLKEQHAKATEGKTLFSPEDWYRIGGAAQALWNEPEVQSLLSDGQPEVALFGEDKTTGVPLKARLDWVTTSRTLDIKTFSQKRGKTIDRTVTDAIWYEGYYRQAYFYSLLRGWPAWNGDFIFAFIESEEPHEVRIKVLRAKRAGQPNLFWERGRIEAHSLIRTYADYSERFGEKPWRDEQKAELLADEDLPQQAY